MTMRTTLLVVGSILFLTFFTAMIDTIDPRVEVPRDAHEGPLYYEQTIWHEAQ